MNISKQRLIQIIKEELKEDFFSDSAKEEEAEAKQRAAQGETSDKEDDPGQYVTTSEEKSRHAKELTKNMKKGYSPQAAVSAIPYHDESDKAYYKSLNKKKKKKGMSESELASRESLEEMIKKELMDMLNK